MIIVTGSVRARPDTVEQILAASLEHVHRSRLEPGCLYHSVHHDAEDLLRLVFLEHWADEAALRTHFKVPASRAFARQLAELGDGAGELDIYDATKLSL